MPRPRSDEGRKPFLDRCMADAEARRDFPDRARRFAFCNSQWDRRRKKGLLEGLAEVFGVDLEVAKRRDTLYVRRPLKNAAELIAWAKRNGFATTLPADDMHVTIAFSKQPLEWFDVSEPHAGEVRVGEGGPRAIERLGPKGEAVVLRFQSSELRWRWQEILDAGATWDFSDYKPHITISWDAPDVDVDAIEPFQGELVFGPEIFEPVDDNWRSGVSEKRRATIETMNNIVFTGEIRKVNEEQRVAYGWFSVIEKDGRPVEDADGHIIGEETLIRMAREFVEESRAGKVMHKGRRVADIVESIVLTRDVQKALGVDLGMVGWFGAMRFRDDEIWERVKKGELRAFSIGGHGKERDTDG